MVKYFSQQKLFFVFVLLASMSLLNLCQRNVFATQDADIDWESDLAFLAKELPERHINMFTKIDQATFESKVESLAKTIGGMEPDAATMELMKLVATVGDGHTLVAPNQSNFRFFRVNVRCFDDGIYVRAIDERHKDLIGAKLIGVGELTAAELEGKFTELFSHDNTWGVRKRVDKQFPTFEYLKFAGATNDDNTATFHFEKNGEKASITLDAVSGKDFRKQKIVNSYAVGMMKKSIFLDLMMKDEQGFPYWNDWLAEQETLYFKYNECRDAKAFKKLVDGTAGFIEKNDVEKFVLDLRDNAGGSSQVFKPLLNYLLENETLNQKGKLFVLVGRDTFSSGMFAAVDMKKTNAIFMGEPTGCKPNHFGEVKTFTLPSSKLTVQYSTKSFHLIASDEDTFEPDTQIVYTAEDFLTAFDPALNAVFEYQASDEE